MKRVGEVDNDRDRGDNDNHDERCVLVEVISSLSALYRSGPRYSD